MYSDDSKTKLDAKRDGRNILDNEAQTACSSACPTGAITFGDANNQSHSVTQMVEDDRSYQLIDHLNTKTQYFIKLKLGIENLKISYAKRKSNKRASDFR